MYTIRIDNLDEYTGSDVEKDLTETMNQMLAEHGMKSGGIHFFPGRDDLFVLVDVEMIEPRIRPGQRSKDCLLSFPDWIIVNNTVNDVLDKFKFYATVKSSKFVVRIGKRRREDYKGGRRF